MPLPYDPTARSNIARLLLEGGRARADAALQSGAAWGQGIHQLGQSISRSLSDLYQYKLEAPLRDAQTAAVAQRTELGTLQLDEARRDVTRRENLDLALQHPSGRAGTLKALEGRPDLYQVATQHYAAIDQQMARLLGEVAAGVRRFGDEPDAALAALDDLIEQGFDAQRLTPLRERIAAQPQAIGGLVDGLLQASPDPAHQALMSAPRKEQAMTVPGADGQPIRTLVTEDELRQGVPEYREPKAAPVPPSVGSFEDYVLRSYGPQPTPAQIATARKVYNQSDDRAYREPVPIVIQTADGPQLVNRMDATTRPITSGGDQVQPAPTSEMRNRAAAGGRAAPVLAAIGELSEKINTGQGVMAKVTGAVERAKAQANLNDDLAEYNAVVQGFTPLLARALGHTGVLTEQDVASVRAALPQPGDSKSVRDRKVARITSLLNAQGGAAETPASPVDPMSIR